MWDLVGNPEDRFSHNEAHLRQLRRNHLVKTISLHQRYISVHQICCCIDIIRSCQWVIPALSITIEIIIIIIIKQFHILGGKRFNKNAILSSDEYRHCFLSYVFIFFHYTSNCSSVTLQRIYRYQGSIISYAFSNQQNVEKRCKNIFKSKSINKRM